MKRQVFSNLSLISIAFCVFYQFWHIVRCVRINCDISSPINSKEFAKDFLFFLNKKKKEKKNGDISVSELNFEMHLIIIKSGVRESLSDKHRCKILRYFQVTAILNLCTWKLCQVYSNWLDGSVTTFRGGVSILFYFWQIMIIIIKYNHNLLWYIP